MTIRRSIAGEPILFAPHRGERPRAFAGDVQLARCPFCPGHEHETPPEIARIGDPWRVRVFPNKYPSVEGAEVIVESPAHDAFFEDITHAGDVLNMYADRLRAHATAPYVALFRNDGARAGSSIPHVHSQLIPLAFVPPRIARELEQFARGCALCDLEGSIIRRTEHFTWIAPAASWMPYQQWIVPRRHVASMCDVDIADLATLMQSATKATRAIGDFNVVMMNFPRDSNGHFYVEILPRVTTIAGLELGTGTFVEIIDPDVAAQTLRK